MKSLAISLLATVLLVQARAQDVVDRICGNAEVAVAVFLGVDCPISQKYVPTLNAIHNKYAARGVAFHAIVPGDIRNSELRQFRRDYALTFDIDADGNSKWRARFPQRPHHKCLSSTASTACSTTAR